MLPDSTAAPEAAVEAVPAAEEPEAAADPAPPELSVSAVSDLAPWRSARAPLEIEFNRGPDPSSEGRIAVVIAATDVTALFQVTGNRWRYAPPAPPLPTGQSDLIVYRVTPGEEWIELARFPLRVLGHFGLESSRGQWNTGLTNAGQVAQGRTPAGGGSGRETFQDFTLNLGWQVNLERAGVAVENRASFVGVSERTQALRFGELADRASKFDLAEYSFRASRGRVALSLGHQALPQLRHLAEGHLGRGAAAEIGLTRFARITSMWVSGSQQVGFDHLTGLDRPKHRILAHALDVDLAARRLGTARITAGLLDGVAQPIGGFLEGAILDAEENRGHSLAVQVTDATQRVGFSGSWARSRFANPNERTVTEFGELVPVAPATRDAYAAQGHVQLLRGGSSGADERPTLRVGAQVERVDPLYRSLAAAGVAADRLTHAVNLDGGWRGLNVSGAASASHNNLDRIASLLRTQTRQAGVRVTAPLASMIRRARPPLWIPAVSYAFQRTHQFGDGTPVNGGFNPTQIPDQVSRSHGVGVQWSASRLQLGYTLDASLQDNRQPGRQRADFLGAAHAVRVGLRPWNTFSLALDGSTDRQRADETGRVQRGLRGTIQSEWRPDARSALTLVWGGGHQDDRPQTAETRTGELRVEAARSFDWLRFGRRVAPIQAYLRYGHQHLRSTFAGVQNTTRQWSVHSGFSLSWS